MIGARGVMEEGELLMQHTIAVRVCIGQRYN